MVLLWLVRYSMHGKRREIILGNYPEISLVEGIYDRHDHFDERREALQLIANKLAPVINQASAKVFDFK